MGALFICTKGTECISKHRLVEEERWDAWVQETPIENALWLIRVVAKVMPHSIGLHDKTISPPPYLHLLFSCQIEVLHTRVRFRELLNFLNTFLYDSHEFLAHNGGFHLILIKVTLFALFNQIGIHNSSLDTAAEDFWIEIKLILRHTELSS